ncbi:MAG: tetratricopeptide repeat protein [Gammaproteobacteria bacterium]|nr:tetratricopeptide repeat protein [Gammaproteobacteria bacterium]
MAKHTAVMTKPGRNDPCLCGSGKKFKQCCMRLEEHKAVCGPSVANLLQAAIAHHRSGRLHQAEAIYQQILQQEPGHPDALHWLGVIAGQSGKKEVAVELIGSAITGKPVEPLFHNSLGIVLREQGKLDAAIASYRKALALKPDFALAHYNLGNALKEKGDWNEAITSYRKTIALEPGHAMAQNNLGLVFQDVGRLNEAIACYRRAAAISPDLAEAYCNLGMVFKDQGMLNAALTSFNQALSIKPDYADAYSNLLFTFAYNALLAPSEYLARARGWELACVPEPLRRVARSRTLRRLTFAGRRLRVGYVSGDFRQHAVSYFVEQLFAQHNRERLEIFAYSNSGMRDGVTERIQALVDHWTPVVNVSDMELLQRIEADGIDVLVDLSGHSGLNRMGVFAGRAAPVQVHYLGYCASTGLSAMDYWIGDEILTPPETDSHFSEQVWRLPRIWLSYDAQAAAPLSAWQPVQDGTIWVGSFNNLGKLTSATLALWAKVLHALPEGKLLLKTKGLADPGNCQRILGEMARHGVAADRIELQSGNITPGWKEHMAYYDRLDIALDPVGAMGGGTTTCDALWMGVPVVALEGDRMASRVTASMLNAIGHPEWVAQTGEEYVDKTIALARNVALRKALRTNQRERMSASPLCDAQGLATRLEDAYIEMFRRWQAAQGQRS